MSEWWRDQQLWRDLGPFLFSEAILSTGEGEVENLRVAAGIGDLVHDYATP